MSHTKGLWEIEKQGNKIIIFTREDCYTEKFDSDFCGTICTMDVTCCPEEDNANAHIISAGPDLLEVMEIIVGVNDEECRLDHHGYCQTHYGDIPCVITLARKAIKKAKGEL